MFSTVSFITDIDVHIGNTYNQSQYAYGNSTLSKRQHKFYCIPI